MRPSNESARQGKHGFAGLRQEFFFSGRRCALQILLVLSLAGCNVSVSTTPPASLPAPTPGTEAQQREAFDAARSVVKKIDRGEFNEVWEESSHIMQGSTTKLLFAGFMSAARSPLGSPSPRPAPRMGFTTQVDIGGPKGEYAVIEVATDFSGTTVTETIVMVREGGQWKLAGYFIKSAHRFAMEMPDPS